MRRVLTLIACLAVLTGATFISTASTAAARGDVTITLVTHDSFAMSKRVLAAFTKQTGITVKVLPAGDAGAALNQAILTKDDPIGDLLFGVDNTFLSRALSAGIFEPYSSRRAVDRPDDATSSTPSTASRRSTMPTCASTTTSSGSRTTRSRSRRRSRT